jgi:hypothetical protein
MNEDAKFTEAVRGVARGMEPPPVPREEMWLRIQQARLTPATPAMGKRAWLRTEWVRWSLPLAAALALGIALGRFSMSAREAPPAFVSGPEPAAAEPALPYVVATVQHLARTQALLSALPAQAGGSSAEIAAWAGDLLTNTRLLMDSPVSTDPQLAGLLRDLELILAQIAALPPAPPQTELQLIEDGIARNDMLGRLRAATRERPVFGT